MAMTRALKRHVSILTVPTALAAASGYQVVSAFRTDLGAGQGAVVAKSVSSSGDVKKRFSSSFRWFDVGHQEGLHDRSSLRTAEGEAKLQFNDGTTVNLGPNSLVVLEKGTQGKSVLRVTRGKIRIEGKGKVELKLPEQALSLEKAKADVEVGFGASKLALLAGTAAGVKQSTSMPISMGKGQSETFIREDVVEPVVPRAQAARAAPVPKPVQSKAVASGDLEILPTKINAARKSTSTAMGDSSTLSQIDMTLEWLPIEGAQDYKITFFDKSGKPVGEHSTDKPAFTHTIKSVSEFDRSYQIATEVKDRKLKSSRIPIKIEFSPPALVNPHSGAQIRPGATVLVTWRKTLLTDQYELELAQNSKFESSVKQVLKPNFVTLQGLKNGTHYWRVRSLLGGHKSPWSQPRTFKIN